MTDQGSDIFDRGMELYRKAREVVRDEERSGGQRCDDRSVMLLASAMIAAAVSEQTAIISEQNKKVIDFHSVTLRERNEYIATLEASIDGLDRELDGIRRVP